MSYLLSLALLAVAVYSQGEIQGTLVLITAKKTHVLFQLCIWAGGWGIKRRLILIPAVLQPND